MTPNQLKSKRKKLGLSQFAVAKGADVSRYNIALYEEGFREFKPEERKSIDVFLKKEASRVKNSQVKSE